MSMLKFFRHRGILEKRMAKLELERRNLLTLQKITTTLVSNLDFKTTTKEIVNTITKDLGYVQGGLFLINKKEKYLYCHAASETFFFKKAIKLLKKPFREYRAPFTIKNFVMKSVLTGKIFIGKQVRDFLCPAVPEKFADFAQKIARIKSNVSLPIIVKDEIIGVLMFCSKKEKFEQNEIELLKTFANQAGSVINNARMYEQIKQQMIELDKMTDKLATTNIRLESAYKKLQKLDKAKSEFVSIASHQLRTPLTAIKGYLSMVLEGDYGKLPQEASKPIDNVYESNERLIKLVNSLLNISRIEAGKMKLEKSEFPLEGLLKEMIQVFSARANKKKLKLKFEKPKTEIPKIRADREKLREALSNLLDNAIKYTHRGGITIKLKAIKNKVRITIADTGEGMIKEEIAKIFQSFSRAGAGRKFWVEGAGLGLYVAKKFIQMHKGKIWAESPGEGQGTTFYIELPVK